MATYSSILAWKIPWTEEPGRLPFMGLQRVGCDWAHRHTPSWYRWGRENYNSEYRMSSTWDQKPGTWCPGFVTKCLTLGWSPNKVHLSNDGAGRWLRFLPAATKQNTRETLFFLVLCLGHQLARGGMEVLLIPALGFVHSVNVLLGQSTINRSQC